MALSSRGAIRTTGAAYDVRPVESQPKWGAAGDLFGFCKDTAQGACAGLLSFLGAAHLTAAKGVATTAPGGGFQSIGGILENLSAGGLAGPVELIGGTVLFLTARRTIARTLGILAFIGFLAAYANGYTVPEMLTALSEILGRVAGALETATQV